MVTGLEASIGNKPTLTRKTTKKTSGMSSTTKENKPEREGKRTNSNKQKNLDVRYRHFFSLTLSGNKDV